MRRAVAITFALAGCAGAPPREPRAVPSLARFADAFAFVPPDMLSFSFDEARVLGKGASMFVASTADVDEVTKCLRVRAGRDFEVPDGLGYGKYRGVAILDFGAGGVSAQSVFDRPSDELVCGVPAWRVAEDRGNPAQLVVLVDGRYVITAHEYDVLELALRRTGRLASLVEAFPALQQVGADVVQIVCLFPRPDDKTYWGRPVPIESMVAAFCESPPRLQLLHRQPLPAEFDTLLEIPDGPRRSRTGTGGWICDEAAFADQVPLRERADVYLAFDMLFGFAIFI